MSHMRRGIALVTGIVMVLALAMAGSLAAQGGHDHGETMATPGHGPMMGSTGNGVVYLTITNDGDEDDALVGGETDRAERVEIHDTEMTDGVARMRPVEGALAIPAGETVTLEPGGTHMMLVNLTADIRLGEVVEVTLEFEQTGEVTLAVPVRLDAEPAEGDAASETVEAGDLVIEGAWSRPAPRIDAGLGTPAATPAS